MGRAVGARSGGFKVLPVLQVLKTGGLGRLRVQLTHFGAKHRVRAKPLTASNPELVR